MLYPHSHQHTRIHHCPRLDPRDPAFLSSPKPPKLSRLDSPTRALIPNPPTCAFHTPHRVYIRYDSFLERERSPASKESLLLNDWRGSFVVPSCHHPVFTSCPTTDRPSLVALYLFTFLYLTFSRAAVPYEGPLEHCRVVVEIIFVFA